MKSSRVTSVVAWLAACAVCVLVYQDAFSCWFLMDDFAWLGLKQEITAHNAANGGGWKLLFEPRAQGTTRVLSERLYFWGLHYLFGMDPLPFRIITFAVQFLNLWLMVRIAMRVTAGSWISAATGASFFACAAWAARPMAWASSFNQVLSACCMLAAFLLFLDWLETGSPRKWWLQIGIVILSFGTLESVIVYPVAVTLWTATKARHRLREVLPIWIPSIVFGLLHLFVIKHPANGMYVAVFDFGLITSLGGYTVAALGPYLPWFLLAGVVWRIWKHGDWVPAFFCFWFVLFLSPVLPFQAQRSEYYLFLPGTGLALALATLMRDRISIALGMAAAVAFAVDKVPQGQAQVDWLLARSEQIHRVFDAGAQLMEKKGVDTLLLSGVDNDLYQTALQDSPFRLIELRKVYLIPGSESAIRARADLGGISKYKITLPQAVEALETGRAAVLSISGNQVFDATARYRNIAIMQYTQNRPRSINVGEPGYDALLGPGWWNIEDKFRWMAKSASVVLAVPSSPNDRLHIQGFCPQSVAAGGPVTLTVSVNGARVGQTTLSSVAPFAAAFVLPKSLGGETMRVDLEVSRVTRLPGDKRELGLIFGTFALRP